MMLHTILNNGIAEPIEARSVFFRANAQRHAMRAAVKADNVRTVCELGFYLGHASITWLLYGHPDLRVVSFDTGRRYNTVFAISFLHKVRRELSPLRRSGRVSLRPELCRLVVTL